MDDVDLNLLVALDALLAEGSVTGAADRLGLSASAMSRTLARLRSATGDPLLVRAGNRLVASPRALAMREQVRDITRQARAILEPQDADVDLAALDRTFTLRANEGFVAQFAAPLLGAVTQAAPKVRLRFEGKPVKEARPLRDGRVDLEIGVVGDFAPEVRMQSIFHDDFVGAVHEGHALLAGPITPERYAASGHVVASRRGVFAGPVDAALAQLRLRRNVVAVVPGFLDAMLVARRTQLVALVPRACLDGVASSPGPLVPGLAGFELPVATPGIVVSAMWHPRMDADPEHRWLRELVVAVCRSEARQG